MAVHTGSEGIIKVATNTVAEIRSYSYEETADTIEDTSMGDAARTFVTSLTGWSGSLEAMWDETDTTGQGALTIGATVTVSFYPEGETTADTFHTGTAIVTGITRTGSFDDLVMVSMTLQGTGVLTESVVA
jgi:hypothetical protein